MLFETMPVIAGEEVEQALAFCTAQVIRNLKDFAYKF